MPPVMRGSLGKYAEQNITRKVRATVELGSGEKVGLMRTMYTLLLSGREFVILIGGTNFERDDGVERFIRGS